MSAVIVGNYKVQTQSESYRIYPKNKEGETIPVTVDQMFIHLDHVKSGVRTTFKRYYHRRQWLWMDSRDQKSGLKTKFVLHELGRMLKDPFYAASLVIQ